MKSILIESQYIGSCSYWKLLLDEDTILIDKQEHFVKRSFRNRAHILGANGLLRLSIPLESGKHQHAAMQDVRISYNQDWQNLHWHSLTSCYRRSPFFEFYEDNFRKFYDSKFEFLIEYNTELLKTIAAILKADINFTYTEKYIKKEEFAGTDFRSFILPSTESVIEFPVYPQVFNDRFDFIKDLSVLDLLFNAGTRSKDYLEKIVLKF
ncbi:MAG TPA: WbqC family protein [Chitinophagales bacterium]|nr:WbqC family protein [Chitinophagales bacterium]